MACSYVQLLSISCVDDAAAANAPQSKKDNGNVQAEAKAGECVEAIQFNLAGGVNPIPAHGVPQQNAENQREVGDDHTATRFGIKLAMVDAHCCKAPFKFGWISP